MSYSWIGPPTPFNGTNLWTGGDSSMHQPISFSPCQARAPRIHRHIIIAEGSAMNILILSLSHNKPQSMVPVGRSSLHYRGFGHGLAHDPWAWLPILRPRAAEICPEYDLGMHGFLLGHHFPMVFLGLLSCVLEYWVCLHWRSSPLWTPEHIGGTESRISTYT